MLRVGPESAGSTPGPACYGRGGERPTITDAMAVLGYVGQAELGYGAVKVDRARAIAAVGDPVTGALTEELAEHRLDGVERLGLMDLAHLANDPLEPFHPLGTVAVLTAVGVGDDADFHAPTNCKVRAR